MKIMKEQILGYYKTDHFLFRQWDRNIPDILLKAILPREISTKRQLFVVSKKIVRKFLKKYNKELIIKADGKVLITCFYCNFQDYFFKGQKKENYYFIYKLNLKL
jgi:hypothetical protein